MKPKVIVIVGPTASGKTSTSIEVAKKINGEIIPAIKTNVVDTTGAGDTFCGVLAVCIAEGMDLKASCVRAVTASGLSVAKEHVIDSIPTKEEVEWRMKNE